MRLRYEQNYKPVRYLHSLHKELPGPAYVISEILLRELSNSNEQDNFKEHFNVEIETLLVAQNRIGTLAKVRRADTFMFVFIVTPGCELLTYATSNYESYDTL